MPKPTSSERKTRKLVAVVFVDIQGYTEFMHKDEQRAVEMIQWFNKVVKSSVSEFDGSIIQFYGDGCLMSFPTAAHAVNCAYEMQSIFIRQETQGVPVRMGIHLGDVIFGEDNVYGDTVNIASRIESLGVPGSILISTSVRDQIQNQKLHTVSVGKFHFKNLTQRMEVFALDAPGLIIPSKQDMHGKLKKNRFEGLYKIGYSLLLTIVVFSILFNVLKKNYNASNTLSTRPVLAIYPFQVENHEDQIDGNTFATALAEKFAFTDNLTTIWPSDLSNAREVMSKAHLFHVNDEGSFLDSIRVTHYLKGSIGLKVHVSLYSVLQSKLIWQDSFKGEDLVSLSYLIYQQVINKLQIIANSGEVLVKNYTRDPELVELFKKALVYWRDRQDKLKYFQAIELLQNALAIDSMDQKVNGLLALIYQTGVGRNYFSEIEKPGINLMIHKYADRALVPNPVQPYALLAKGSYASYHLEFDSARIYFEKAQSVAPEMELTTKALAEFSLYTGDYTNALKHIQHTDATKPGDQEILRLLSWCLMSNGFVRASKENTEKLLQFYPNLAANNYYLWAYYLIKKDYLKALEFIPKTLPDSYRLSMEGILFIDQKDDQLFSNTIMALEENIQKKCIEISKNLPRSTQNESRELERVLNHPFSQSTFGFITLIDTINQKLELLSMSESDLKNLKKVSGNLEGICDAYNSLSILYAFHSGSNDKKRQARKYYQEILQNGKRFPFHWWVQTYPFDCFNTFRTDPEIQMIAERYGINFSHHPWYTIQYEAK